MCTKPSHIRADKIERKSYNVKKVSADPIDLSALNCYELDKRCHDIFVLIETQMCNGSAHCIVFFPV